MGLGYEVTNDSGHNICGLLTGDSHFSDGMGGGTMRASIVVTPCVAANSPAKERTERALPEMSDVSDGATPGPSEPKAASGEASSVRESGCSAVAGGGSSSGSSPRASPQKYRIDVSRYAGDTFQFHAFYRALRETLRPLIGWTASPQFEPRSAQADDATGASEGRGGEPLRSPRSSTAFWTFRRMPKGSGATSNEKAAKSPRYCANVE